MGYFSHITNHSFRTSPTGERLFLFGGFWSKPYVIPDQATEAQLRRKMQLFWKSVLLPIFFAPIALMMVVLGAALLTSSMNGTRQDREVTPYEDVSQLGATDNETTIQKDPARNVEFPKPAAKDKSRRDGLYFLAILAVVASVDTVGRRLLFRKELSQMRRLSRRLGVRDFFGPMAKRNSYWLLIFGLMMFGGIAFLQTCGWAYRVWVQGPGLETFTTLVCLVVLWWLVFGIGVQIFLKMSDNPSRGEA